MSEASALLGVLRRQQVMVVLRAATFIGTLLLVWISLRPFQSLAELDLTDASSGNDTMTYALFGGLAVLTGLLTISENRKGFATLRSPGFLIFGGWILVSVVLSTDIATSVKRFALTAAAAAVASMLFFLPRSQSEMVRWFSIAVLGLLAICYLGLVFAPNLSIHLATDLQEPLLAGDWRGVYGHKNVAAAMMAIMLFLGIYIVRSGLYLAGSATMAMAVIFLINARGKSALALCVVVLVLSSVTALIRSFWLRAIALLSPLLILNMLSVGTVMSDHLAAIARMLPFDTSFTGRTEIWEFALQSLRPRLPLGYGFAAFWGTGATRSTEAGMEWTATVAHSHNGYLDTALAMGLPGLMLLIAVLVIAPLRNFQLADRGGNNGPLTMALLRIWLFGIYLAGFESFYLDRADPIWFTFLTAVLGMHYLARFRTAA
ncbi:MAG TPA: O-antigen ligase [Bradyrhizobium sp.]|uniref:O-antigen ligase family protein n=1 Tax=Bradyrhizobium sp. TaxID=376 RepID=UPI002C14C115|nr:O-antigen ligase [Bradyrhizobium sp.]HLZ02380.1 O-antigen ligase [Bradyrhizobium sp.]